MCRYWIIKNKIKILQSLGDAKLSNRCLVTDMLANEETTLFPVKWIIIKKLEYTAIKTTEI